MSGKNPTNQDQTIEALMELYEKKNRELEEREMEARYRLQLLENTMPALMMWNIWRIMLSTQGGANSAATAPIMQSVCETEEDGQTKDANNVDANREEDLILKMKQLEDKLNTQTKVLASCRVNEDSLRGKLQEMENWMIGEMALPETSDEQIAVAEIFEKLSKMAHERMEMDKRIKELELREETFKETLDQADNFIAQLDLQFQSNQRGTNEEPNAVASEPKVPKMGLEEASILAMKDKVEQLENDVDKLKEVVAGCASEKQKLTNIELERCIAEIRSLGVLILEQKNGTGKEEKGKMDSDDHCHGQANRGRESSSENVQNEPPEATFSPAEHDLVVNDQPVSLLAALSSVSAVHVFVYLFMALLVLRRSANK